MEWLGKGAFAPNHCTEGCPANEYPWFFGLSIPIPQRFEIVEPFVGQLIMQILRERSRYLIFIVVLGQFLLPSCSLRLSSSAIGSSARLRR